MKWGAHKVADPESVTGKDLARDIAFGAGAQLGGIATQELINMAIPEAGIYPQALMRGAGSAIGGGIAAYPFAEDKNVKLYAKSMAMDMLAMALFDAAQLAISPEERLAAMKARDAILKEKTRVQKEIEQSFKSLGVERPPKGYLTEEQLKAIEKELHTGKRKQMKEILTAEYAKGAGQATEEAILTQIAPLAEAEKIAKEHLQTLHRTLPERVRDNVSEYLSRLGRYIKPQVDPRPGYTAEPESEHEPQPKPEQSAPVACSNTCA
jgi:hypothetical protein